jgi:hypothetical protein
MKTSIKMLTAVIATLAAGAVFAEGYGHYGHGVTSTDTSSFSGVSVSSGSEIAVVGNGAAYSNQIVGAGAQNTATAVAEAGHGSVGTLAATSGSTGVLAASQSDAIGHAYVDAGTSAVAVQGGSAEANAANRYHHPSLSAESEAAVGSVSGAGTNENGFGIAGQETSAGNIAWGTRDGRGDTVSTSAATLGGTSNEAFSLGQAGSLGFAVEEGEVFSIVR